MKINNTERNRVFLVFIVVCLWVLLIGASLIKVQVIDYSKNVAKVNAQSSRTISLMPKRGTIYDRNGEVLAISVKTQSLYFNNRNNAETLRIFNEIVKLAPLLFTEEEKKSISERIQDGEKFLWVKRKLDDSQYELIKSKKIDTTPIPTMGFVEEYKRLYPQKTLASHILGGVGIDEQGLYGLEYSVDSLIRGKGGKMKVVQDARRKAFDLQYIDEPVEGKDIYLTIDASIQYFVERELKLTVEKYSARLGSVIVLDSTTGAILAMASAPDFCPDEVQDASPKDIRNKSVSNIYHPGSTFKIVTACIALENNAFSTNQVIGTNNGIYFLKGGLRIYDDHKYGELSFEDVIVHSSNIGAAKIGEKLGKDLLYQGIKNFGFGSKANLRLPDEESGIFNPLAKWSGVSVDYIAHGYEIGVTPLQMIRAYNVLASGGYMIQPFIIKDIQGAQPRNNEDRKTLLLNRNTVRQMTDIMVQVVERGTGKNARIENMPIAAKTGTSKKINRTKDGTTAHVASFGGFFPAYNPNITMFVMIDEPKGAFYGGDVAAPLFKAVAEKIIVYLGIFNTNMPSSNTINQNPDISEGRL